MFGTVPVMQVAIVVYDGVFDSGLTAILDVLDNANALGGQIHEPPTWDVTMVGPAPQVRTGAGLLLEPKPLEHAQAADLLVVTALAGYEPAALLEFVGGDASLPVRDLRNSPRRSRSGRQMARCSSRIPCAGRAGHRARQKQYASLISSVSSVG